MAKRIESQRTEAYRIYMSDSLALINTSFTRGEADIPRYIDLVTMKTEPKESAEEIVSRFDTLRRN